MGPKLVELVKGGMSFYGASAELGIVYSTMRSWAETIPEFGGFFAIAKQYWTEHLIQGGLNNTLSAPMCLGMLRMTCGFMDEDRRQMLELKKKEIEMIPMLNTLPTFIEASTSNKTVDEHLQEAKKTIGKELNVGTVYTEIKLK